MKKIFCLFLSILLIFNIFGCKKKSGASQDDVQQANSIVHTQEDYDSLVSKVEQLTNEIAILDGRYKTIQSFRDYNVVDARNSYPFNKIGSKIILNQPEWAQEKLSPAGLQSGIKLGDKIVVRADSWVTNTEASTIHLCIQGHAVGDIMFHKLKEGIVENDYFYAEDVSTVYLDPFFEYNSMDKQRANYRQIFYNNEYIGQEGEIPITIYDSTTEGQTLSVPANQILSDGEMESYKFDKDADVEIQILTDTDKEINAKFRIGIAKVQEYLLWYQFITYDRSGELSTDDLIQNIFYGNNSVYIRKN